jgi:hypothetical protein
MNNEVMPLNHEVLMSGNVMQSDSSTSSACTLINEATQLKKLTGTVFELGHSLGLAYSPEHRT